ncbi:hypothetical protein E1H18_4467 [Caulobacter sp. RHG1]|nr:hypothetical protein [Caulobacter sp. RHG1]
MGRSTRGLCLGTTRDLTWPSAVAANGAFSMARHWTMPPNQDQRQRRRDAPF